MDELKLALRRLAKAVVIVTAVHEERRYAMSATAVCEVSFDPPSMLVCVNRSAGLYPALAAGTPFGINILHHSQAELAGFCGGKLKGDDRFLHGAWTPGAFGVPCLADAQASIVCRQAQSITHGTHGIFIGDVAEVRIEGVPEPLIYLDGRYTSALMAIAG